jgi:hypothetical protein
MAKSTCRQIIGPDGKPKMQRIPYDVNGKPLKVGDTVRAVEWGSKAIHRLVKAIGDGEHTTGWIMVTSSIAWEHPRHYERIK